MNKDDTLTGILKATYLYTNTRISHVYILLYILDGAGDLEKVCGAGVGNALTLGDR